MKLEQRIARLEAKKNKEPTKARFCSMFPVDSEEEFIERVQRTSLRKRSSEPEPTG
jgi:hypothetical protein